MVFCLLIVEFVLNQQQNAAALQDLGPVIADFLGPDRFLSLSHACHFGSLKLLNWMWRVSSCNCNTSSWSLVSHLHSNSHYYQWQFSEALVVAAGRGDVEMVQWICDHFNICQVAVEVVEIAAKNGHLKVLQVLLQQDQERKDDCTAGNHFLSGKVHGAGHKVQWGGSSLVFAVENGHFDVVQWLCRYDTYGGSEAQTTLAIKTALLLGHMKVAEFLLPRGKCILDYADYCSHPDVIEWKLNCGYFQRDVFGAGVAIKDLVMSGRLGLMQKLAQLHVPPPENSGWSTNWRSAMVHACMYGNCEILQWLMEHPSGRWTLDGDDRLFSELTFSTAYNGSIQVMEYLYEHGVIDKVRDALVYAIRENHLHMVKWLVEHFPQSERMPVYCVMDEAVRYGRLEMLNYFQSLDTSRDFGLFPSAMSPTQNRTRSLSEEKFITQIFVPSADDYRKIRPMLCRYRSQWDPTDPMDDAAANGHLEVVKWLHFSRSEGCTTAAMDCAAANGHLDVVKWLHTHRTEGCTSRAMDGAAENGHLDVLQWMNSNRCEGYTVEAIKGALKYGHLRVAAWLHTHLPSLTPGNVLLWRNVPDLFDLLLFRSYYFTHSYNASIIKYAKQYLMYKSNKTHIFAWLQEEFPAVSDIREEE